MPTAPQTPKMIQPVESEVSLDKKTEKMKRVAMRVKARDPIRQIEILKRCLPIRPRAIPKTIKTTPKRYLLSLIHLTKGLILNS